MMNKVEKISSLIWSSADDVLRGLFKQSEYGKVILPFVVLRRLDCVLEPVKDEIYELHKKFESQLSNPDEVIMKQIRFPFFNSSRFDLSRIKSDPNNVYPNFMNYLDGYSKNVREIIKYFSLNPTIEKLQENNRLYVLLDKFTEFDLHPEKVDNHQMGSIYEELLRRFSEMSNEESGDHYTPRDVVRLLVSIVFSNTEDLKGEGLIRNIYDPCCGTGGMLSIAKSWLLKEINSSLKIELYGQTLLDESYAICKSDFLILGENPENIKGPRSTLSDDKFEGKKFNFMMTNPPFGMSWKSDEEYVKEESKDPSGRFSNGLPWIKDGQLLFLSHMISKMDPSGSVIGLVTNGSPLTTGNGLRGESQFRKFLIEKDLIDSIVILPDDLFFNTGILCYLWVLNNNKDKSKKGFIRVINCLDQFTKMYKPIGDKRKIIDEENLENILKLYKSEVEDENIRIFKAEDFLYNYVSIHRKKKNKDGSVKVNKTGQFVKESGLSEKIKLPLKVNIDNYIQKLNQSQDLFYIGDETVVGGEFHLTKYFYKADYPLPIEEVSTQFNDTLNMVVNIGNSLNNNFKETEVDREYWFGSIPEHWKLMKIDECFSQRLEKVDGKEYIPLSVTKSGIVPQMEHVAKSKDTNNRSLVKVNDFVINSRSDRRGSCGISTHEGCVSSVNSVLTPNLDIIYPQFIHGLFRTKEFQEEFYRYGKGIVDDLWTTSWSEMREILIPIPTTIKEQVEIASELESLEDKKLLLNKLRSDFKFLEESLKSELIFRNSSK